MSCTTSFYALALYTRTIWDMSVLSIVTLKPISWYQQARERQSRKEGKDRGTNRTVIEETISTGVLNALIYGIHAS